MGQQSGTAGDTTTTGFLEQYDAAADADKRDVLFGAIRRDGATFPQAYPDHEHKALKTHNTF
jgi:hypothetical protein